MKKEITINGKKYKVEFNDNKDKKEETTFIILASKENHKTIDDFLTEGTFYEAIKINDDTLFNEDEKLLGDYLRYTFQNLIKKILKDN